MNPLAGPIRDCTACSLRANCTSPVPGVGNLSARVMYIGEGPGYNEDVLGEPFQGRAGRQLDTELERTHQKRSDVWIDNLVRCRVAGKAEGGDAPPPSTEAAICGGLWLDPTVDMVRPELIVTLGREATRYVLGNPGIEMSECHGLVFTAHRYSDREWPITVIPVYHPAAGLRNKEYMRMGRADMGAVEKWLDGKTVEATLHRDACSIYGSALNTAHELANFDGPWAVDTETTEDGSPLYVQISPTAQPLSTWDGAAWVLDAEDVAGCDILKALLSTHRLIFHNAAFDLQVLWRLGVYPQHFDDTMIMAWMLQDTEYGLKSLAARLCGMEMASYDDTMGVADQALVATALGVADSLDKSVPIPALRYTKKGVLAKRQAGVKPHPVAVKLRKAAGGRHLRERWVEFADVLPPLPPRDLRSVPQDVAIAYSGRDAVATLRVRTPLWAEIESRGLQRAYHIDIGAIPMVAHMESVGVPVDFQALLALGPYFQDKLAAAEAKCRAIVPGDYSLTSGDQVAAVLFDRLKLPKGKMTKGRTRQAVDNEALQALKRKHPFVPALIEHKQYSKLIDGFVEPLIQKAVGAADGGGMRVFGRINTAGTLTGRYRMHDPNLSQMPMRTEEGRLVRGVFRAPQGKVFLSMDYKQIEMCGMAVRSGDPTMLQWIRAGRDIHRETAARVFGKQLVDITTRERFIAKSGGFGAIYWIGVEGFTDYLHTADEAQFEAWTDDDSERFLADYFKLFPKIKEFGLERIAEARRYGWVVDAWGRIRLLPDIHSQERGRRAEAEREAVNTTIQSWSMGVVKIGMKALWGEFCLPYEFMYDPVYQVHDEVLGLVGEDEVGFVAAMAKRIMEESVRGLVDVPVVVEAKAGERWGELKEVKS